MTQARERAGSGAQGAHRAPGSFRSRRPSVRLILILVLAAAVIAFIAGNTKQTSIRVIVPVVTMPLWLALVGTAAISLLVGWLLTRRK